jgi:hypothetical protein
VRATESGSIVAFTSTCGNGRFSTDNNNADAASGGTNGSGDDDDCGSPVDGDGGAAIGSGTDGAGFGALVSPPLFRPFAPGASKKLTTGPSVQKQTDHQLCYCCCCSIIVEMCTCWTSSLTVTNISTHCDCCK